MDSNSPLSILHSHADLCMYMDLPLDTSQKTAESRDWAALGRWATGLPIQNPRFLAIKMSFLKLSYCRK